MSHLATIDLEIKDLAALAAACKEIGLEFVSDQKTYNWWGKRVGSTPYVLPTGFTEADLGKCDHAIKIPGAKSTGQYDTSAYEIGVVRRRDGKAGFTLLWDFYKVGGLKSLIDFVGPNADKLKQSYAGQVAVRTAQSQGFRVTGRTTKTDGTVVLTVSK